MALSHAWKTASTLSTGPAKDEGPILATTLARAAELYDETRRPLVTRVLDTVHAKHNKAKRAAGTNAPGQRQETENELRARVAARPDLSWLVEHDVEKEFRRVVDRLGY